MPDTHDLGRLFAHSVVLDPEAPIAHRAITAEYDDPCRYSNSLVIRTPLRRRGRWHGIRKSWLSVQVKLPTGEPLGALWGIVLGWWRYPEDDGWSALLKAVRMGRTDGDEARNFEDPDGESMDRARRLTDRRRVDDPDDAGTGA